MLALGVFFDTQGTSDNIPLSIKRALSERNAQFSTVTFFLKVETSCKVLPGRVL